MKRIFLIILLVPSLLFSQTPALVQDKNAEPMLEKIARDFSKDKAYQVEFKYTIYSAAEDATVSDFGSVIIKGNKYKLKTDDSEVYFDGKHLWTYSILNEEVYKSEPAEGSSDQALADPFKLLSDYKSYYKYLLKGESLFDGKRLNETELYPFELESEYSMIELYTEPGDHKLHAMVLKQKNGIELRIYVKDIIRNLHIDDSVFIWNETDNPDILLIEM